MHLILFSSALLHACMFEEATHSVGERKIKIQQHSHNLVACMFQTALFAASQVLHNSNRTNMHATVIHVITVQLQQQRTNFHRLVFLSFWAEIVSPILYNILQAMGSKFAAQTTYSFHASSHAHSIYPATHLPLYGLGDTCAQPSREPTHYR